MLNEALVSLKRIIAGLPRVRLTQIPTPLEPMPRLTSTLGGPSIWVKRDDLTGLALGGNKSRMFEFVIGAAKAQDADVIIGGAAVQSNYCCQLAAACAKAGIECHLLLRPIRDTDGQVQGNRVLDVLFGAHIKIIEDCPNWVEQGKIIKEYAAGLERAGRKVYLARVGDETTVGLHALAYVEAAMELVEQSQRQGLQFDELWVCSSDTTQAGLALGFKHLGYPVRLVGVPALPSPVTHPGGSFCTSVATVANQAAALLGIDTRISPSEIVSLGEYCGPGYGILDRKCLEAILVAARYEGLVLDPVYTGKAFAALLDYIRKSKLSPDRTLVFLHTGGIPAVFAYAEELAVQSRGCGETSLS